MTWRFGSGLVVIPNLFRDLVFWLMNLGLKAPSCRRGSLLNNRVIFGRVSFRAGETKAGSAVTLSFLCRVDSIGVLQGRTADEDRDALRRLTGAEFRPAHKTKKEVP
jgi:hypothetical protein